jgi:N-hydroxyarylamine O-acetyltransferase
VRLLIGWLEKALKEKGYSFSSNNVKNVAFVQKIFADYFPFENLDVLLKRADPITPEFLYGKMIDQQRGGLCYEINPLLFLVLKQIGLDPFLAAATVKTESGWATDRTHVLNLFWQGEKLYAADSGFGSNLPLQPVELDGPAVHSPSGSYRLRSNQTEKGSTALESKTDKGWAVRYAFFPEEMEWEELNQIKRTIHTSPQSNFNKALLIAQALDEGTLTINEERLLIRHANGDEQRILFHSSEEWVEAVGDHFSRSIYQAAVLYMKKKESFRISNEIEKK